MVVHKSLTCTFMASGEEDCMQYHYNSTASLSLCTPRTAVMAMLQTAYALHRGDTARLECQAGNAA